MLLDTLKKFAFYGMDVQILKDNDTDYIVIENSRKEFYNRHDGYMTMNIHIVTKINLDGELLSSRISENIMPNTKVILIPNQLCDKYPSYNYFNKVPLRCGEAIQKSMEVCSCDIPKLAFGDYINIDRFGRIEIVRLCDRKIY